MENIESSVPKKRSQAQKIGKHKYELQKDRRQERRLERIEKMLRIIFHGFQGYFHFDRSLIEEVACESEMDEVVVSLIFEVGSGGILAKEIAAGLPKYNLERHKILRIVNRVNRNVKDAFGRRLIEKRGKKWAFTDFGVEIWGETAQNEAERFDGNSRYEDGS